MPLPLSTGGSTILLRREAYERSGLARAEIDARLGLTPDEFRVEHALVAIGPVYDADALSDFMRELEEIGLEYYADFFELSGNWPEWLRLFAAVDEARQAG
ncbi:MAG TPA: hypothetical protein VFZ21_18125 [Gemmatimonadaceae bacterium]|nr:hypothetical protein [Gemmatimonadaceae bacterium]